jgi:hypothetical protein
MPGTIGPLLPSDERFDHQIVDTFASVAQSDLAWTEKVCGMACAKDGSLQIGFGFGKYTNRNVLDGYGGISRGVEQRTVRASRRLSPDPETMTIGPLSYQVIEPLRKVRVRLEPTPHQPIAFDLLFEGAVPCFLEDREDWRVPSGYRHQAHQIRYHQTGTGSGWVEVEGKRTAITPDTWVSTRDHSWGVRPDVGLAPADLEHGDRPPNLSVLAIWNPVLMQRPDGTRYAIHHYLRRIEIPGVYRDDRFQGGIEHPDGRKEFFRAHEPEIRFHPVNRRFQGGRFGFTLANGADRLMNVEVVSETGFHLGTGLYHGFDGWHHGSFRGELHVDGECVPDCSERKSAERVHQIRDCVVRVKDPVGGGEGIGNCQTVAVGAFPDHGLPTADDSFL